MKLVEKIGYLEISRENCTVAWFASNARSRDSRAVQAAESLFWAYTLSLYLNTPLWKAFQSTQLLKSQFLFDNLELN